MIEIEDLTKRYGDTTVVDDVSMTVEPGHDHGRGRHLRLGQVDAAAHDQPAGRADRGPGAASTVEDTMAIPEDELRRRIGYAIQGHGLFPHRTVAQNIATVPRLCGWDQGARSMRGSTSCWTLFQLDPASSPASTRTSSRAASSSASAWRGRWRRSPSSC